MASASIANGAPSTWTSTPPTVGAATYAIERLPFSSDIASTNRARRTTATNTVFHETSNTTVRQPLRKPTT